MDMFLNKHSSRPFNPDIANAFFRSGLIETWGRGIERIKEACEAAGVPEPEWQVTGNDFWTTFYFTEHATTIQLGTVKTGDAGQVTAHDTAHDTAHVDDKILKLLSLLENEIARSELMEKLELAHRGSFMDVYLRPAFELGLIEMTLPGKPKSRQQKYRLTVKGRKLVSGSNQ